MISHLQNNPIYLKKYANQPLKNTLIFKGNNQDCFTRTNTDYKTQDISDTASKDTYDTFTGLKDKKTLLSTIERLISSTNKKIYLAMFDIDNFKSINELLGYKIGDEFILEITKIIKEEAQKENFEGYRFGGEEFIILGCDNNEKKIKELCKRILERFQKSKVISQFEKEYVAKCKKELKELLEIDSLMTKIKKAEISYELLSQLAKKDAKLLDNPTFKKEFKKSKKNYKNFLIKFTMFAIEQEKDLEKKNTLKELYKKIKQEKPKNYRALFVAAHISEHLLDKYENQDKIHQINRWLSVHQKNKGFSATCSIIDFNSSTLKSPMELVNEAGEELKLGKNQDKGKVYIKSN